MDETHVRFESIKYMKENIGTKRMGPGLREDFMNLTSKAREAKAKISEWNCIKLKSFCTANQQNKKTSNQMGDDICNRSSSRGSYSKYRKNSRNSMPNEEAVQLQRGQRV